MVEKTQKMQSFEFEIQNFSTNSYLILVSIVVSIPACHAGDRGSIPRRGDFFLSFLPLIDYEYRLLA